MEDRKVSSQIKNLPQAEWSVAFDEELRRKLREKSVWQGRVDSMLNIILGISFLTFILVSSLVVTNLPLKAVEQNRSVEVARMVRPGLWEYALSRRAVTAQDPAEENELVFAVALEGQGETQRLVRGENYTISDNKLIVKLSPGTYRLVFASREFENLVVSSLSA